MSVSTSAPQPAEKDNQTGKIEEEEEDSGGWGLGIGITIATVIFFLIWSLLGLVGFVKSLQCGFFRDGDSTLKIFGIIIAFCFGPLYWPFFLIARKKSGYCQSTEL